MGFIEVENQSLLVRDKGTQTIEVQEGLVQVEEEIQTFDLLIEEKRVNLEYTTAVGVKPFLVFRTQSAFVIGGLIHSTDLIPTFFVAESAAGQVTTLEKIRYKVGVGINVTFRLLKNGSTFGYGTTGTPLTATTSAATSANSQALNEDDEIELDILGVSGAPSNLSVTLIFQHTVS